MRVLYNYNMDTSLNLNPESVNQWPCYFKVGTLVKIELSTWNLTHKQIKLLWETILTQSEFCGSELDFAKDLLFIC